MRMFSLDEDDLADAISDIATTLADDDRHGNGCATEYCLGCNCGAQERLESLVRTVLLAAAKCSFELVYALRSEGVAMAEPGAAAGEA